jgi:hypothetical protein
MTGKVQADATQRISRPAKVREQESQAAPEE